ncbi:MAG: hypothetical protein ACYCT2_06940 [Thermoplasmataceae archaeon]
MLQSLLRKSNYFAVILVTIAILTIAVGTYEGNQGFFGDITYPLTPHNNMYMSPEFNFSGEVLFTVDNSSSPYSGLIPASEVSIVNESNINSLSVPLDSQSSGSYKSYFVQPGSYYYVAFGSEPRGFSYEELGSLYWHYLNILGALMIGAALILVFTGHHYRKRNVGRNPPNFPGL